MKDRNKIMRFFGLHPQNDVRRKFAFTLAEVLVTLGIIGVVAVLTVPNIISNYQKKVYVAQLQKAYSQLQQVFDLAMADDEVEYLADTELLQSINVAFAAEEDQSAFSSKLSEYMKIQKVCQPRDFSDGCHSIRYTEPDGCDDSNYGVALQVFSANGAIYFFDLMKSPHAISDESCKRVKEKGGNVCAYHSSEFAIDINGVKGPNRRARDLFYFVIDDKGQVYPSGSISVYGRPSSENKCPYYYGIDCAGRIYDSGWVMDY